MDMFKRQTEPLKMNNIFLQRDDVNTFNRKLMDYLIWYNTQRLNKSLNNLTPIEIFSNIIWSLKCMQLEHLLAKISIIRYNISIVDNYLRKVPPVPSVVEGGYYGSNY